MAIDRLRTWRRALSAGGVALALLGGVACRAIADIDSDLRFEPGAADGGADAGERDAHATAEAGVELPDASACPTATPEVVFRFDGGLGPMFVTDASVYAEPVYDPPDVPVTYAPYTGLIACSKTGCESPRTVASDETFGRSSAWGSVALSPGAIYATAPSLPPATAKRDGGAQDAGSIRRVTATAGGQPGGASVVRGGLHDPLWVATAGDTLYWVDDPQWMSDESGGTWTLFRCTLPACSDARPFMNGTAAQTFGLFLDTTNAYVVAADPASGNADMYACALTTSCSSAPAPYLNLLTAPSNAWPFDPLLGGDVFVSDGTSVYWADYGDYEINRLVPGAAAPELLTNVNMSASNVAVDATYVYWTLGASGTVQRTRKDNAWKQSTQNVLCRGGAIGNIAVDGASLFYETTTDYVTTVWRVALPPL